MVDVIKLKWNKLKNISKIEYSGKIERGVYCWGFIFEDVFIPYYIGIADNIIFRLFEHINAIVGGKYTIFHSESLANFSHFKNQEPNDKRKGKIYSPDWKKGYKEFIVRRKELNIHIDYMIEHLAFSYAVVEDSVCSRKSLGEIEKICITQIGKEHLINTKSGYSERFKIVHLGNETMIKIFDKGINL